MKLFYTAIILLFLPILALGASFTITEGTQVIDGRRVPTGYAQYTTLSASTPLTVPAGTRVCMIQAEAGAVRWRDDGTDPTAASGGIIASGSNFVYTGDPSTIELIAGQGGARANVHCYR